MRLHLLVAAAVAALNVVALPAAPARAETPMPTPAAAPLADHLTLPPPKAGRARRLVAVIAGAKGAEVTDFLVPYGVLKDSGLFDVRALSPDGGAVELFRAVRVRADQSFAAFDAEAHDGADIVVVPAQIDPKDKALLAWLKAQAARGATIVSICEGARVLANAQLLDGRRATTHWRVLGELERKTPAAHWVRDRRYVQDGPIISTTGVSASLPVSIALVEAAGGAQAAQREAARIGLADWSARHRTADFQLGNGEFARAAGAYLAPWTHETVEIPLEDGVDVAALALRADAWMRSFRTRVVLTSLTGAPVRSAQGLTILPDGRPQAGRYVAAAPAGGAAEQLDATLADMGRRYGPFAVRLARLTMEYAPVDPAPR